jgi:hypothetical protein
MERQRIAGMLIIVNDCVPADKVSHVHQMVHVAIKIVLEDVKMALHHNVLHAKSFL